MDLAITNQSLLNKKLKHLFLIKTRLGVSSTEVTLSGPITKVKGDRLITYKVTLIISDGTGQAVIGGGGAPAGHVNGMPNKKSQSTSKLSAKGE